MTEPRWDRARSGLHQAQRGKRCSQEWCGQQGIDRQLGPHERALQRLSGFGQGRVPVLKGMIAWAVRLADGQLEMRGVAVFAGTPSAKPIELQLYDGAQGEKSFREHMLKKMVP